MRPRSLRARLIAAAATSILAAVLVLGIASAVIVNRELHSSLDRTLRDRAGDVARLSASAPALLTSPGALEAPLGGRELSVEVLDARGRIVARSLSLGARLLPVDAAVRAAIARGRAGYADARLNGKPIRVYAAPLADLGGQAGGGAVLVASDTSDIDRTIRRLRGLLALGAIVAALVAGSAAALLTRRGLRPLSRLSAGANEIERTGDPARRLPEVAVHDEIGELTETLNRMLEALERARASERRFLADAAHELRTPVTALLGNVEYLARHGSERPVIDDLRGDARRLRRLVDDLLTLERERASPPARERVDLADLVREAAARSKRVRLATVTPATVAGDPNGLERAIENLIENGLVHGPAGGVVTVSLATRNGRALVAVHDDGAGPDPDDRERLFERFWRGTGASGRPGSGLGLAIVDSVVRRHGGHVEVDGSTFTISLPVADGG